MGESRSLDAALLAGGRSNRFGSDKAFFEWKGEPLYQRQLSLLDELGPDRLWLSANSDQAFEVEEHVSIVLDEESDLGPAGGLLSVFHQSEADDVLVLGVDLPLMERDFLVKLIEYGSGVVPKSERFWEPLAAIYPRLEMMSLIKGAI
ncbi:MAG: molybdenum cofactor guanylyltransferase [Verrucomicrobiota bacterium]